MRLSEVLRGCAKLAGAKDALNYSHRFCGSWAQLIAHFREGRSSIYTFIKLLHHFPPCPKIQKNGKIILYCQKHDDFLLSKKAGTHQEQVKLTSPTCNIGKGRKREGICS